MNKEKLYIKEVIIVEGKYDKIKLKNIIASPIIQTNGFRIFKDKEKVNMIRKAAENKGLLIMTDSDSAGFVIRNFLKGIVPKEKIKNCYIPEILGKEKRKSDFSKEGKLGVEGIDENILIAAIRRSGAVIIGENTIEGIQPQIEKIDFYNLGLTGRDDSAKKRTAILKALGLPTYITTNAMIETVNCIFSKKEFYDFVANNIGADEKEQE